MKKIELKKCLFLIISTCLVLESYSQYASLNDAPMFRNNKQNFFVDTVTSATYSMEVIDSLYKTGKSPFQILGKIDKGDSLIWKISFLKEMPSIRPMWINKKFPLPDLVDMQGNKLKDSDIKGKTMIINCWSISCGPCLTEIPYLNKLIDSLGKTKFLFIGLTFDHRDGIEKLFKSEKVKEYLKTSQISFNFTIIPEQEHLLNNVLRVINYPTTFIVDSSGVIREIIEGVFLDEQRKPKIYSEVTEAIEKL